ncbi:hypothetical protein EAG_14882 [Camponotus floridanus]|uniref:Uncharacterized protein n=1 Tax=Camponotus floridanus TaxID=104421 RepID=E2B0W1_CAMFO|nr:hypothetical protein EAG_14882 [Camponotus floridanus]
MIERWNLGGELANSKTQSRIPKYLRDIFLPLVLEDSRCEDKNRCENGIENGVGGRQKSIEEVKGNYFRRNVSLPD